MNLTLGSLCSGVGGLELGVADALSASVVFQVENDPFCQRVLRSRFPGARLFEDIRDVGTASSPLPYVDVLCAGWPCQGNSVAGLGRGLDDERSGLWRDVARILRAIRPAIFIAPNFGVGQSRATKSPFMSRFR